MEGEKIINCPDGVNFGMRGSTRVLKVLQNKLNSTGVLDLLRKIQPSGDIDLNVQTTAFMECVNEYNRVKGIELIDEEKALDYIDSMGGVVPAQTAINEAFMQFIPKNQTPPQTEGEKTEPSKNLSGSLVDTSA